VYSITEQFDLAIQDARECIRLSNGGNVKGYMRLVKGCAGCHLYAEALETLQEGIAMRAEDSSEREELVKLQESLKARKKVRPLHQRC
jgi:hypothetical protein